MGVATFFCLELHYEFKTDQELALYLASHNGNFLVFVVANILKIGTYTFFKLRILACH